MFPLRMTAGEMELIKFSAKIRNLSVAEFIRRAALGRRADVRYETEMVLALREAVMSIRDLHAAMVERGIPPPEEMMRPVINEAIEAIKRVSNCR